MVHLKSHTCVTCPLSRACEGDYPQYFANWEILGRPAQTPKADKMKT